MSMPPPKIFEILNRAAGGRVKHSDSKTVYIARHGATAMNNSTDVSADRIRGWKDIPLVEEGRDEARKAAKELEKIGIDIIVSSDLSRAKETADIIGKEISVKPIYTEMLRPWNLGNLQGASTKAALPQISNYVRNKPSTKVIDGESFNQFKDRAFDGLSDAIDRAEGKILLIVTHHRVERLLKAWDRNGQPDDHSIDLDEFLKKGDPPGGVESIKITLSAL